MTITKRRDQKEVSKKKNIPRPQPNEDGYLSVTLFDQSKMYLSTRVCYYIYML
jgi:hypothetical protein